MKTNSTMVPRPQIQLPRPATQERGEDRGEGHLSFESQTHLLSPALSSISWRRGSVGLCPGFPVQKMNHENAT